MVVEEKAEEQQQEITSLTIKEETKIIEQASEIVDESDEAILGEDQLDGLFKTSNEVYNLSMLVSFFGMLAVIVVCVDFMLNNDLTRLIVGVCLAIGCSFVSYYIAEARIAVYCSTGKVIKASFYLKGLPYESCDMVVTHWRKEHMTEALREEYMRYAKENAKRSGARIPKEIFVYAFYTKNVLPERFCVPNVTQDNSKLGKFIVVCPDHEIEYYMIWSNLLVFVKNMFLAQSSCVLDFNIMAVIDRIPRCFLTGGSGKAMEAYQASRDTMALAFRDILETTRKQRNRIEALQRDKEADEDNYNFMLRAGKRSRAKFAEMICRWGHFDQKSVKDYWDKAEEKRKSVIPKEKRSWFFIAIVCGITAFVTVVITLLMI